MRDSTAIANWFTMSTPKAVLTPHDVRATAASVKGRLRTMISEAESAYEVLAAVEVSVAQVQMASSWSGHVNGSRVSVGTDLMACPEQRTSPTTSGARWIPWIRQYRASQETPDLDQPALERCQWEDGGRAAYHVPLRVRGRGGARKVLHCLP